MECNQRAESTRIDFITVRQEYLSTGMWPLERTLSESAPGSPWRDAERGAEASPSGSSFARPAARTPAHRVCLSLAIAVLVSISVLASPAPSQERVRVKASAGEPATTSVPSADESIPLYTVRARIQRSGGLPVSWLMTKLLELSSARGGASVGASIGAAIGASIGSLTGIGAPIAVPAGTILGGLVGSVYAERMAELLGTLGTTDLRCGVDLDIVAPALVDDNPYGRWRLDIPFEFESARMPTATAWDSTTFVDAGSTITATAQDSLCRGAAITVEFEFEYDCDLYCDTTDPSAVCPESCRSGETLPPGGDPGGVAPPAVGSTWTNSLGMEFVGVPAGSFVMGSPEAEPGRHTDEVQHTVRISRAFWMGKHEVTQGQWKAVMGENPSYFGECGSRCPVEFVSWNDVQEFIRRLNELESGNGYRLPTEAEWEYALRAGTTGVGYAEPLDSLAWHRNNSGGKPHPVGLKRANAWGLHDMLGNVSEWVGDWYGEYPSGSATDPQGPNSGLYRVFRGESWDDDPDWQGFRAADRGGYTFPDDIGDYIGFRVVMENNR